MNELINNLFIHRFINRVTNSSPCRFEGDDPSALAEGETNPADDSESGESEDDDRESDTEDSQIEPDDPAVAVAELAHETAVAVPEAKSTD